MLKEYQAGLKAQKFQPDAGQARVVTYLNNLQKALNNNCAQNLNGVYIYGPVGRGKSMLMHLFCSNLNIMYRRVHFHAFMEELHQKMHNLQGKSGDPVTKIAQNIAEEARVLCFDEFYITNIADAMLLGRLFEKLFAANVLIIATSNWSIPNLFQGGVNRAQFKPFIKTMENNMDSIELASGPDYRTKGVKLLPNICFTDHYSSTDKCLEQKFLSAVKMQSQKGSNKTKKLTLPDHLTPKRQEGTAAWYSFNYLCNAAIGREDYLLLAEQVTTLVLENIPLFSSAEADSALRLITLIDILYENNIKLICSAADVPQALCPEGDAAAPFLRTASRLMEMQSPNWGQNLEGQTI